jgi:hypothetical protein
VKLYAILNDCPPEFEALFTEIWDKDDLVLKRYGGLGPGATLYEQSQILSKQTDAPLVYFAEDDYFYLPAQFHTLVDFMRENRDADFAGAYEHPDLNETDLHDYSMPVRNFGGREWLECMSTTHCFMARRETLGEIMWIFDELFRAFKGKTSPDLAMWMPLTKKQIYNPWKPAKWIIPHRHWGGSVLLAWYYGWRQILFGRKYNLFVCRPSIATHMVARQLAPGIDWQSEFHKLESKWHYTSREAASAVMASA